jgi:hypothetical protein
MIPDFNSDGNLPPGVHFATWDEVANRFGTNTRRKRLLKKLSAALKLLRAAGCRRVYLNGSFVTSKRKPNDYDVAWDSKGVNVRKLLASEPAFGDFDYRRAKQIKRFGGEFFPAGAAADLGGNTFLEFFQIDKKSGLSKGIVGLDL